MKNRKICLILTIIFFINISFFIQNVTANNLITEEWYRTWGGSGGESGRGIALDSSNNIYIAGVTSSLGEGKNDSQYPMA